MGIVSISPMWSVDEAESHKEGRGGILGWRVLTDSNMTAAEVAAGAGVPQRGDSHPWDSYLFAQRPRIRRIGVYLFDVWVDYASPGGWGGGDSPVDKPPDRRFFTAETSEPIDYTTGKVWWEQSGTRTLRSAANSAGNPLTNAVNEPIDCNETFYDLALEIKRNVASINPVARAGYVGRVSSDVFYGFEIGQAKIASYEAPEVTEGGFTFYQETWVIHFRLDGWTRRFRNEGYRIWWQSDSETHEPIYKAILDGDGRPVSKPVLLDENGQILPADDDPVWIIFATKGEAAFADLELEW